MTSIIILICIMVGAILCHNGLSNKNSVELIMGAVVLLATGIFIGVVLK